MGKLSSKVQVNSKKLVVSDNNWLYQTTRKAKFLHSLAGRVLPIKVIMFPEKLAVGRKRQTMNQMWVYKWAQKIPLKLDVKIQKVI